VTFREKNLHFMLFTRSKMDLSLCSNIIIWGQICENSGMVSHAYLILYNKRSRMQDVGI
jgi:hypothetical protein